VIAPLEQEFGWSRAQITAGPLIISFIAVLTAPLAGLAIDRFGPRPIALFGIVFFCSALAFASTATPNIMSWWVRWAILGFANMFVLPTVWATAVSSLFQKSRGMALAITLSGTGITAAVVPSLTNYLVEQGGWRYAYVGLGLIFFVLVMPAAFFLFRGATDKARARARSGAKGRAAPAVTGIAPGQGLRSTSFLKLGAAAFVFTLAGSGLTANGVPILRAQGFDGAAAAGLAGLIGIGSIAGRLGGGYLLDRFDAKKIAALSVSTPILAIALFLWLPGMPWVAGLACLIIGLSVGTEVDAAAYLAARHFGMRSFGTIFGSVNGLILFAHGLAPIGASYVYDLTRSYDVFLWAAIPICLAAAALFLSLGRYPEFDQPAEADAH
jgi:MFS family permease